MSLSDDATCALGHLRGGVTAELGHGAPRVRAADENVDNTVCGPRYTRTMSLTLAGMTLIIILL